MVALVTPMGADGTIDYEAFEALIEFHEKAGTQALVVAGTTGESATLARSEHIELIARACEMSAGRMPVIAGTGSNSTSQTLDLSRAVDALPVAGFLVVTPYYNKPTQEGLFRHFSAVADAVEKPVILYNVPGRTGVDMLPKTVIRLAQHNNIAAVKEATGDVSRVEALRRGCGSEFGLLSGDDGSSRAFMLAGGDGVISVTGNVAPGPMRLLCDAARSGDSAAAAAIDAPIAELHRVLFVESNPIPVKWALARMGLIGEGIRLPLTPLAPAYHDAVANALLSADVQLRGAA
jgi:4-hydroxy-tetrahydrodipicolinate synthase